MEKKQRDWKMLWTLFTSMFMLSACTFGGGFVIVSLMKKKYVEELGWLEESEMLDITAIAQSSPGPIPINAAVILGYRMQGVVGSLIAILGTAIPPLCIISLITTFYTQFRENEIIAIALTVMRAGVAAVICDVVLNLAQSVIKMNRVGYVVLMVIAFVMSYVFGMSAITIILLCVGIGFLTLWKETRTAKAVLANGEC
ncbi:MAG: chromate transporter [Erysipelotrichaceae bacterium]